MQNFTFTSNNGSSNFGYNYSYISNGITYTTNPSTTNNSNSAMVFAAPASGATPVFLWGQNSVPALSTSSPLLVWVGPDGGVRCGVSLPPPPAAPPAAPPSRVESGSSSFGGVRGFIAPSPVGARFVTGTSCKMSVPPMALPEPRWGRLPQKV